MCQIMDYLKRFRRLLAIAEAGKYYGKDPFDQERYDELAGVALELIASLDHSSVNELESLVKPERGYPTPKVDVRGFIRHKNKVLLVKHRATGEWSLPGGYADVGLSPKENVLKEIEEETGQLADVLSLRAIFDTNLEEDPQQLFQYYRMIFECRLRQSSESRESDNSDETCEEKGLAFSPTTEITEIGFFSLNDLPVLSKARTTVKQLTFLFQDHQLYSD